MRGLRAWSLPLVVAALLPLRAAPAAASSLPSALDGLTGSFSGGAAVWVSDPTIPGPLYARDVDRPVVTASLYKLAVLADAEHEVDLGRLHYSDTIEIGPDDITDDGSDEPAGTVLTLDQALEQMITVSDNGTAIHLWRMLGPDNINSFLEKSGVEGFHVRLDESEDNVATARALGTFFTLLERRKLVSAAASDRMLARLERQRINDRIPAQLPQGTVVAHKTGDLVGLVHDAGIVFTPRGPRVVVAMTWDGGEGAANAFIARLASAVYDAALAPPASARYALPSAGGPIYAETGTTIAVPVGVTNTGPAAWTFAGSGRMALTWELRDARNAVVSRAPHPLPLGSMPPGSSLTVPVVVTAPPRPGDVRLVVGLVDAYGRPLWALGVASAAVPIRVHVPFVVDAAVDVPPELPRGAAAAVAVEYLAREPVRPDDHRLALAWRFVRQDDGHVAASGVTPLGTLHTYQRGGSFVAPLVAPNASGTFVLEYELREGGSAAGPAGRRTVDVEDAFATSRATRY